MRWEQHSADRDYRRHNGGDEARRGGISGSIGGHGSGTGGIISGFNDQPGIRRGARGIPGGSGIASGGSRRDGRAIECGVDEARDDPSALLNGRHRAGR